MEIDPHNLPSEVNLLQQIVLQLLQAVEDKTSYWRAYNTNWHNCCAIATGRNGSVSTKTSYSCLPRRSLLPVSGRALHLQAKSRRQIPLTVLMAKKRKKSQSAAGTAAKRCRNHWSVAGWCLTWKNRNANAGSAKRPCTRSGKMSASDWSLFPLPCRSLKKFAPSTPVRKGVVWRQHRNRRRPL